MARTVRKASALSAALWAAALALGPAGVALAQERTAPVASGEATSIARGPVVAAAPAETWLGGAAPASLVPTATRLPATASIGGEPDSPVPAPLLPREMSLVIVIQAALAERGCYLGQITGEWDAATEAAAKSFVEVASLRTEGLGPSDSFLQSIRSAAVTTSVCTTAAKAAPAEAAGVTATPPARKATASPAREAKPSRPAKPPKRESVEREKPTKVATSRERSNERSAPARQTASPGPAVFARPVGVGRF
jgi:hypothetical protein